MTDVIDTKVTQVNFLACNVITTINDTIQEAFGNVSLFGSISNKIIISKKNPLPFPLSCKFTCVMQGLFSVKEQSNEMRFLSKLLDCRL